MLLIHLILLSGLKGQFVGVIGTVGSGKSSLLSAFVAEMRRLNGKIYVDCINDGFGLVSQEPWIQHASLRYAASISYYDCEFFKVSSVLYLYFHNFCGFSIEFIFIIFILEITYCGENHITITITMQLSKLVLLLKTCKFYHRVTTLKLVRMVLH